jgi:imidazolonepropionase-like amidohydrolase
MIPKKFFLIFACLAGSVGAKTIYIRAGKVFDGQQLLDKRTIIVEDGLIKDVGDWNAAIPESAEVIDAGSQTVLPGFIDSHIHFIAAPLPFVAEIEKHGRGKLTAEEMSAYPGHRLDLLKNGVTTIVDMGASLGTYLGLRKSLKKGSIVGPELYFSGPEITAPAGHPAGTIYIGQHDLIDNGTYQVADTGLARKKVIALARQGVDFIEIVYDQARWFREGGAPRLELKVARAVIDEAHNQGLKVFARVGSEEEARAMVGSGVDGIERGFATGSDTFFSEMSARGIFFTPAICADVHDAPVALPDRQKTLKRAYDLKVPLCIGTDFPASNGEKCGDDIFKEMKLWEDAGIPRLTVLKGSTSVAAAKIGKAKELGMIAPGYRANLIFLDGSVEAGALTADRIARVMLHGLTVIENQKLPQRYARRFRENSLQFLGYPYWDPLLSVLIGASVSDCDLFHTGINASADLLFSIRNMWFANLSLIFPSPIPRTAIKSSFHFDNQNRLFYGIGNETRLGDTTEYVNLIFRESVSGVTRITKQWKFATALALDQSRVSSYKGKSLPAMTGDSGGNETVVSVLLIHDTRDHENNPWFGHFIAAGIQIAPSIMPSSHSFQKVIFDARGYVSVAHRHIIAGRLLYDQAFGTVPFYYLPELGGDTVGRGYLSFRFRDRVGLYGQLEYRFPIWNFLSGAVFADFGQFQKNPADIVLRGFHPAVGFGPRFIFDASENSIVGIDVGFTPEGWNLVLRTGHAF